MVHMSEIGLREAHRRATAHALSKTAFALTREHGLDGFTLEELAEQAGVSRRTFANYFSCKEEAVTALALEQLRDGIKTMPALPESTPLIDWVRELAKHQLSGGMLRLLREMRSLAAKYPALNPYLSEVHTQIRREAQMTVSARAGNGVSELTAHILVGAAYGALMALLDGVTLRDGATGGDPPVQEEDVGGEAEVDHFLGTVFSKLRSGF